MEEKMATSRCCFCNDAAGHCDNVAALVPSLPKEKYIYLETKNFLSTPELHPVLDGNCPKLEGSTVQYFLTVPREHNTAFLQVDPSLATELESHRHYLRLCVNLDHHTTAVSTHHEVFCEHGQAAEGNRVKSIYNAHVHQFFLANVDGLFDFLA
ncbi:hypothetical protein IJJ12_03010, partial [bacterium]|nr:hypothetical protein [bacterium]